MNLNRHVLALALALALALLAGACASPYERSNDHAARAQAYFDAEDYVSAELEALNAVQIEPRNANARLLLGLMAEEKREYFKAVGHFRVVVEVDPAHVQARLKLGNLYAYGRIPAWAAVQSEALMVLAPENAEVWALNARILYLNGDAQTAMEHVDVALEINPFLLEAIIFKAGLLLSQGDVSAAIDLIDGGIKGVDADKSLVLRQFRVLLLRAADRNDEVESELQTLMQDFPDREEFAVSLAQLYASQDVIDQAEAIVKALVEKDPSDIGRRIIFVRFIAENRGYEKAIEALQEIIAGLPDKLVLRLLLGRLYEATDSIDQALDAYRSAAARAPLSKEGLIARNRMALIFLAGGEIEVSRKLINAILKDESNNPDARLLEGLFNFSDGMFDQAIADLRMVLRSYERSEQGLLLLARSHVGAGKAVLAQSIYRQLIGLNPIHISASNELAQLLASSGNLRLATDVMRKRLAIEPDNRVAATALIDLYLVDDRLEAAEQQALTMLEFNDPSGLAEYQLGRVLQAKGADQEAMAAYSLSLQKDPKAGPPLQGIVDIYLEQGRINEAITYLEGRLDRYPEQLAPKLLLGKAHTRKGDIEAAKSQFERVIDQQPEAGSASADLAALYSEDAGQRINIYRRGFVANPDNPRIGLLLAIEHQEAQEFDEAIGVYERILETNPEYTIAVNNLAALLLDQRSDDDSHARALMLAKVFAESQEPALADTLGWAYYRNGEFADAIRYLELAVAKADGVPLLHYHLGMAYYSAEDRRAARSALRKAIGLAQTSYPGIDEARAALDQILESDA